MLSMIYFLVRFRSYVGCAGCIDDFVRRDVVTELPRGEAGCPHTPTQPKALGSEPSADVKSAVKTTKTTIKQGFSSRLRRHVTSVSPPTTGGLQQWRAARA